MKKVIIILAILGVSFLVYANMSNKTAEVAPVQSIEGKACCPADTAESKEDKMCCKDKAEKCASCKAKMAEKEHTCDVDKENCTSCKSKK